jgi:hypothetical protein
MSRRARICKRVSENKWRVRKEFCRKRHEHITLHDREVDLRNIRKVKQFREDDESEQEIKEEHNDRIFL